MLRIAAREAPVGMAGEMQTLRDRMMSSVAKGAVERNVNLLVATQI
jgi:hypothetical protein